MKVTLQNLTKKFPNRNKKAADVIAVNDFTFEIPDGKLIGLLGPSGCGFRPGRRSAGFSGRQALPPCSSPMTRKKP